MYALRRDGRRGASARSVRCTASARTGAGAAGVAARASPRPRQRRASAPVGGGFAGARPRFFPEQHRAARDSSSSQSSGRVSVSLENSGFGSVGREGDVGGSGGAGAGSGGASGSAGVGGAAGAAAPSPAAGGTVRSDSAGAASRGSAISSGSAGPDGTSGCGAVAASGGGAGWLDVARRRPVSRDDLGGVRSSSTPSSTAWSSLRPARPRTARLAVRVFGAGGPRRRLLRCGRGGIALIFLGGVTGRSCGSSQTSFGVPFTPIIAGDRGRAGSKSGRRPRPPALVLRRCRAATGRPSRCSASA